MKKIGIVGVCVGGTSLFYPYFDAKLFYALIKKNGIRQSDFQKSSANFYIRQIPASKISDHLF